MVETKGKGGQRKAGGGEICIQKPTLQPTRYFTSEKYLPYKHCFSHMTAERIMRKFKTFTYIGFFYLKTEIKGNLKLIVFIEGYYIQAF